MAQKILLAIALTLNVLIIAAFLAIVYTNWFDAYFLERGLPKYCQHLNAKFPDKLPQWCPNYLK